MSIYTRIVCMCRFAQFFQTPLFNASATDREVKAVDSGRYVQICHSGCQSHLCYAPTQSLTHSLTAENDRNLQEDVWRVHQVLKELSKEGHPHKKFQTGTHSQPACVPVSSANTICTVP